MAKFIHLTDKDGAVILVNADGISTVETPRSRDAYGNFQSGAGSVITMTNTQRLSVKQIPKVIGEYLNDSA